MVGLQLPSVQSGNASSFHMGDTPVHDKLHGLWISTKAQLINQMCNTPKDKFCDLEHHYTLWDSQILHNHLINEWHMQLRTWDTTLV